MKPKERAKAILEAEQLGFSTTGFPTFRLSDLKLDSNSEIQLPNNIRLGHLVEKIVSELIRSSSNFKTLHQNVQLIEHKRTIGEIDFILEDTEKDQIIHMELAYKFYLYDPEISSEEIKNWIGPNRNDSLVKKLNKLKNKQFPLLQHPLAKEKLQDIKIDEVKQELCLLAYLYVPYNFKGSFEPNVQKTIKGYYLNFETFKELDEAGKSYYIPAKREWGMDPSENENWSDFKEIEAQVRASLKDKLAPLIWQKHQDTYTTFFIVWW